MINKTTSYVQAVKMAVKRMEERNAVGMQDSGWFWVNRWKSHMINPPKLSNHREI